MIETNIKKQRIIEATIRVLKERSIEDVSMRNIASEAGLTTGAIYHHFKNKEELFFAVMQETLHFSNNIYTRLSTSQEELNSKLLLEEIQTNIANRLRRVEEQKFHISIISDMLKQKGSITEKYKKNYAEVIKSVSELFLKAFDLEDNPNKVYMAYILVAAMDGMALQQAVEVLPKDMEKTIEVFNDFFSTYIPKYLKENK